MVSNFCACPLHNRKCVYCVSSFYCGRFYFAHPNILPAPLQLEEYVSNSEIGHEHVCTVASKSLRCTRQEGIPPLYPYPGVLGGRWRGLSLITYPACGQIWSLAQLYLSQQRKHIMESQNSLASYYIVTRVEKLRGMSVQID